MTENVAARLLKALGDQGANREIARIVAEVLETVPEALAVQESLIQEVRDHTIQLSTRLSTQLTSLSKVATAALTQQTATLRSIERGQTVALVVSILLNLIIGGSLIWLMLSVRGW